jgi:hypothetical protein
MTMTVAIRGMAGVEQLQPDGSFVTYQPGAPISTPIKPGDRLRIRLEVADDAWIYAVSAIGQAEYRKVGVWAPGERAHGGVRILWPGGHALTADEATMTTLFVVGSREQLPWARDLTQASCASLVGHMPTRPPTTACDHLYGLFWKAPRRVRGLVAPPVDVLEDGATRMPAIVSRQDDAPYAAIEWQFKPAG